MPREPDNPSIAVMTPAAQGKDLKAHTAHRCTTAVAALLLGAAASLSFAQSNKVFRCTGANGKVTLSDRRCPEDDSALKTAANAPASAASAPQSKLCQKEKDKQPAAAC